MAWLKNDDGTLSCTVCGTASFRVGRNCDCPQGVAAAPAQTKRRRAATSKKRRSKAKELPAAHDYERKLLAIASARRRLRTAIEKAREDNVPEVGEDGKLRFIRAWEAEHSKLRMRDKTLENERKTYATLHEIAIRRELPELVERYEQLVRELKNRTGGARRAHRAEARVQ